jgi:hypothetical protein
MERMRNTHIAINNDGNIRDRKDLDFPNGIEFVILCCETRNEIYLTIQIQADKHL